MDLISDMRLILGEDQDHDRLIQESDKLVDYLAIVRKTLLGYQQSFGRERNSPFAEHISEMSGELARIVRQGIVDIERAGSMLEP